MGSSIRLEGDVRGLMKRCRDFSELNKGQITAALGEGIRTSTLERFKTERDPEGKKWAPSIRARETGGKTLSKSAGMKNSIKVRSDSSGAVVGTNKIYAATHQLGEPGREITIRARTSRGLRFQIGDKWFTKQKVKVNIKIDKRPYLGLNDDDLHEIKDTLEDILRE